MSAETINASRGISHTLFRAITGLGLTLSAGGLIGACSWPWLGIDQRTSIENMHADRARADSLQAVLALSGSTLFDKSTSNEVLLQRFIDGDTIAIKTSGPDPAKAKSFLAAASTELSGTHKNDVVAVKLGELARTEDLSVKEVIDDTQQIRWNIQNGDMISWKDVEIELGAIALIPIGLAGAGIASDAAKRRS